MSKVREFIESFPDPSDDIKALPLMHSCDGFTTRNIIEENALKVTECKVFKENLLYFFYGKPAYEVSARVNGLRTDNEYLPVCFIVPFDKVKHYRAFPFDTGAYDAKLYNKLHLHHNMKMDEFELENSLDGIKKYISVFYKDNYNYVIGVPSTIENVDDPYIKGLISINNTRGEEEIDVRAHTIEVIVNENVSIENGVECIIMPEPLLRSQKIKAYMKAHPNIDCRTYDFIPLTAPNKYNAVVFQKAMDYLREKGVL